MKKFFSVVLCVAMMLSVIACGKGEEKGNDGGKETEKKTTLTVAIPSDTGTFFPYYQLSGTGRMLYTPVYEALFFYDENSEPEPILVDEWVMDEDGMGITMKLKRDIKFSDGTVMTADDVMFSLDCLLNSNYANNIGDIDREGCHAVDETTVYFHYNSVPGPLLYYLCNLYIVSEDYMSSIPEDDWTYDCIGTGPYTWGEYIVGTEYQLVPNEYYREEQKLTEIRVKVIAEASVQAVQLETGEIDMAMGLKYRDIAKYDGDAEDGFSVTKGSANGSYAMWVNMQQAPYDDLRVREAFAYALDLEAINSVAFSGMASPARNIYSSGTRVFEEAQNLRGRDVEKAKQLLADAGYPDGVTLDVYCINSSAGQEMAEVMISSCEEAGITLNVTFSDFPTVIGTMQSGAEGYFLTLTYCNGDPYILLSTFCSGLLSKICGMEKDEEYQRAVSLYREALTVADEDERYALYRELMNISYDNCFTTPLMDVGDSGVHPDNLKGFWMSGSACHYEDAYWE